VADFLLRRYRKSPEAWNAQLRRYLPTHLAGAGLWDEVVDVLLDLPFLEAKIHGPETTVFDIVADFESILAHLPEDHEKRHLLFLVSEILRLDAAFLAGFPDSLFQCLWNRGHWHDCAEAKTFFAPAAGLPPFCDWEGAKLNSLVEQWRIDKENASPRHAWLRARRPLPETLGSVQRSIIRADSDSFSTVSVSPDGSRIIASILEKGLLGVWDARSSAQIALLDLTEDRSVHCVRFFLKGPRRGLAAAVTWDGRLIVMDDALQVVDEVQASEDNFGRVALSPDGKLIATGDWKGIVSLWEAETMALLRSWPAHADQITALEFSPCGQYLASGEQSYGNDNHLRIWSVFPAEPHLLAEAKARYWVESLCFSQDGKLLYCGDYEGAIERWSWGSGERLLVREEHDSPVSVICLFDDHHLLCGVGGASNPVPVEVWNLAEGRIEQHLNGHLFNVGDLALIPGTTRFVSVGDSTLRIWDLGMAGETRLTMLEPEVSWVAFREPQGWVITAAETRSTVWVRTLASGALVMKLEAYGRPVSGLALSHEGRLLACGADDGSVYLWDLDSGQEQWQARHHEGSVTALAFSPDDSVLATGAEDGRVNLLATENGVLIRSSKIHGNDWVHTLAISNNGRLVASSGYSSLKVWNIKSRKVLLKLKDVIHYALWFAPGDEILIAEGMSQFGMAWKIATGEPLPDGGELRNLYDAAMLRAGRRWQWHSPGNIGWAQEYLRLIDTQNGAAVAAFPELQGGVQWHPAGFSSFNLKALNGMNEPLFRKDTFK